MHRETRFDSKKEIQMEEPDLRLKMHKNFVAKLIERQRERERS
jgi:hypothetical protein